MQLSGNRRCRLRLQILHVGAFDTSDFHFHTRHNHAAQSESFHGMLSAPLLSSALHSAVSCMDLTVRVIEALTEFMAVGAAIKRFIRYYRTHP